MLVSHDYMGLSRSVDVQITGEIQKNVEDFVFFSVNFRPGKLVGNSSLFFPLKREKTSTI